MSWWIYIFKDKVEALTEHKISVEDLKESIKLINAKRAALQRLYDIRKKDNLAISGKDALVITQIAFYDDPVRFTQKVNELCDELENRVVEGISVFEKNTPRILVAGTPMAIPNWKMHHLIESNGGAVVCEETLDEQIKALSDRYLGINCGCFTPNENRIDDIIRLVKAHIADGVVYYSLPFCHTYGMEYKKIKDALDKEGIPVIMIETDYSMQDAGQIKTRLDAFFEMLETSKGNEE